MRCSLARRSALTLVFLAGLVSAQGSQAPIADRIAQLVNTNELSGYRIDWVKRADQPLQLERLSTSPFTVTYTHNGQEFTLEDYYDRSDVLAFIVLKDARIVVEQYFHGTGPLDRYASMSIGKSLLSILVGIAIEEQRIGSVKDRVVEYLPYLKDSGYRDATLQDILRMASGVKFREAYTEPDSDFGRLNLAHSDGTEPFSQFAASLESENEPGTTFRYQSVNSQVMSLALEQATGMSLAKYTEEKLWKRIGSESDAYFFTGEEQPEICGYGCFYATARDFARFGLMAMHGGSVGGVRVVPAEWMRESTTPAPFARPRFDEETGASRNGYAYYWWVPHGSDGAFRATGIRGQAIYVNPMKRVVIAQFSAWPQASASRSHRGENSRLFDAIAAKLAP